MARGLKLTAELAKGVTKLKSHMQKHDEDIHKLWCQVGGLADEQQAMKIQMKKDKEELKEEMGKGKNELEDKIAKDKQELKGAIDDNNKAVEGAKQ
eukprot:3185755-Prymnesium_polylepis.1